MSVSTVKIYINMAREYLDSPYRIDDVEPNLAQAEQRLPNLDPADAARLQAEIDEIRTALDNVVKPADARQISAAQGKIKQALDYVATNRGNVSPSDKEFLETLFKMAVQFLDNITDERKADKLKAPVLAEIERIQAQYGTNQSAPPPPPQPTTYAPQQSTYAASRHITDDHPLPSPSQTTNTGPSAADATALARATRTLAQARSYIHESRRTDPVEALLYEATSALSSITTSLAEKDRLLSEATTLRADLAGAIHEEAVSRITSELDRRLSDVESDIGSAGSWVYSVRSFQDRLGRDDVKAVLSEEQIKGYETRFDEVRARHEQVVKGEAMARAEPAMRELRDKLERNPFDGLKGYDASRMDGEVNSLRWAAERAVNTLPEGDADRVRLKGEIEGLMAKLAGYSEAWAKQELYDNVRREWDNTKSSAEGWEREVYVPGSGMVLDEPQLPNTRTMIHRARHYLRGDQFVQRTRDENPGDSFIAGVDREAEEVLEQAGTKMADAFGVVMEAAEKMDVPIEDQYLRSKPLHLLTAAQTTFEGTRFHDPVVGRIQALNQRWEDELAAVREGREKLGAELTAEGLQKWPSIIANISTVAGFDPMSAKPGDAVHLQGVYNRAGWDFGGEYGFSMRFNGVPLGGVYEDYVVQALDFAAYHQKLRIDDHEAWDVVGVVLGPGSIKERTTRTVRMGLHTEEIEEWIPVNCVRMRVIALRAGPVVVGPPM